MLNNIITFLGIIAKLTVLFLILAVIFQSVRKHGQPKVVEYNIFETLVFNLLLIVIYSVTGLLNNPSYGMIILFVFHFGDIAITFKKNNYVEFTKFNAFKSSSIMIFYFLSLFLVNFWSPVLRFTTE